MSKLKKFFGILCFLLGLPGACYAYPYGRVKVVTAFADYKVKIVECGADVTIRSVGSFPGAGEWQFVENNYDFTVQLVENFEDFTVMLVD